MIPLAQARQTLLDAVSALNEVETLPLMRALGRVAANDVQSTLDIPPQANSAMDGFAVKASDVCQGEALPLSQRIPAGTAPGPLQAMTAARIFTGGVVPEHADAVVIQENCEYDEQFVTINGKVSISDNIRPRGQDIRAGAVVVERGQRLSAVEISLLASIGVAEISVIKPIRVALFSTGDELVEPGQPLQVGQIYNSNRPLLISLCTQLGFEVFDCGVVADTLSVTKDALAFAAQQADFIISSGGVSVGEEDHIKPAVEALGRLDFWKIQMKPGKPVAFGRIADTPFLGLPGNPVSSFVVFQLIGLPLLHKRQGATVRLPMEIPVTAQFAKKCTSREEYIRVRLSRDVSGELHVEPFANLSSGVMSSLAWADGLVRQEVDSEIQIGQRLTFLPIENGILVAQ